METFLIVVYLSTAILISLGVAILYDPFVYWVHRKGYPGPGWKFLVAFPLFLGITGSILAGVYGIFTSLTQGSSFTAIDFLGSFLLMFVPGPVGIGLSALVLRSLPRRQLRLAGSHRSAIPYAAIGYAALLFAALAFILSLLLQEYYAAALRCVFVASLFSGMMFYLARRAKTPSVETALSQDQRPALLYLRSFDQEGNRFAEVSQADAAKYSEITRYAGGQLRYNLTLEQFLGREIQRKLGPFIALGNPTDYLPPEGAYRTYATDADWQAYFTNLSNRSAAILMQMGDSDNLVWELVSIRERGLQTRLFVVTPPLPSQASQHSINGMVTRLTDRIKGIRPAAWDRFAATLEKAGYTPSAADPGQGAVVTFDERTRALPLACGVKTPAEYVSAIAKQVEKLSEGPMQ